MTRLTRPLAAAALSVLLCITLASCTDGYKQGPAGKVVDKDQEWRPSTKTSEYELTTRDKDGVETEFRVSGADYRACYHGSAYPRCTEVR